MNALGLSLLLALSNFVSCQQQESCRYDLEEIMDGLNASSNVDSFVVNCLAHNGTHAEAISISVYYSSQLASGDDSLRYDFQCVGGTTLIPTLSRYVSNISNPACTACNATAAETCEARCDELCGSCDRNDISDCTTCRYLRKVDTDKHYCLDGSSCSMQGLNFTMTSEGCECDGYLQLVTTHENESLYLLPEEEFTYKCIGDCGGPNKPRREGFITFCDMCGVEKCINCSENHRCTECVGDYRMAKHGDNTECITKEEYEERRKREEEEHMRERREELRKLTEKLMEKQEDEEEERDKTVLLLRILLPIFCILTLVVCVGMSVFTHYWYPYIDEKGKKRIKTKPTEESEPTVWRPSPTIRFR